MKDPLSAEPRLGANARHWRAPTVVLVLIVGSMAATTSGIAQTDTAVLRITVDSVGPMPAWASLRTLQARFAADIHATWVAEEHYYAGIKVSLGSITAVGTQFSDSLDLTRPADTWMLSGNRGLLPRGVLMSATWGDLRRAYGGRVDVEEGDRLAIRFCVLPSFVFYMRVSGNDITSDSLGPTNLAASTRIERVQIAPGSHGYDLCTHR